MKVIETHKFNRLSKLIPLKIKIKKKYDYIKWVKYRLKNYRGIKQVQFVAGYWVTMIMLGKMVKIARQRFVLGKIIARAK